MIELRDLTVHSGAFLLERLSLTVNAGRYGVLMGATGRGKTTILEAICGLRRISRGRILVDQVDVTDFHPSIRGIGYVPQDLALFPTLTVRDQLAFALRLRGIARAVIETRTTEVAAMLGIDHLLSRRPKGLSGGEAQRVAIGRAVSFEPRVLLLDEPFTSLDEETSRRLCQLVKRVQAHTGVTVLHVTHSQSEALLLADQLFCLSPAGLAEQPTESLRQPVVAAAPPR